jgi:hypothetical protein
VLKGLGLDLGLLLLQVRESRIFLDLFYGPRVVGSVAALHHVLLDLLASVCNRPQPVVFLA